MTPYNRTILLVYWKGVTMPGTSVWSLAVHLRSMMPHVDGIMIKVINGTRWQGTIGDEDSKSITSAADVAYWVDTFARVGWSVHVWGVPRGVAEEDIAVEADLYAEVARIPGVKSVLLDVEHGRFYWNGTPDQARALMERLRRQVGAARHIGMILDPRHNRDFSVWVDPWLPYVDSLHPMIFPLTFGSFRTVDEHIAAAFETLRPYGAPIVPMLQSAPIISRRPSPLDIALQAQSAWNYGAEGVSFFRLGLDRAADGKPLMSRHEYLAVDRVRNLRDPMPEVVAYTWQELIDVMAVVAPRYGSDWESWFEAARLRPLWDDARRHRLYDGPPVRDWAFLSADARRELSFMLDMDPAAVARSAERAWDDVA